MCAPCNAFLRWSHSLQHFLRGELLASTLQYGLRALSCKTWAILLRPQPTAHRPSPHAPRRGNCTHALTTKHCIQEKILSEMEDTLPDLCVSSLRRGHANLLCVVPILSDVPRRESMTLSGSQKVLSPFSCRFFHCCFANFSHCSLHCPFVLFAFFLHSFVPHKQEEDSL